ncbi:hypothetical protein SK128_002488, partial [Halocaridina rubra]
MIWFSGHGKSGEGGRNNGGGSGFKQSTPTSPSSSSLVGGSSNKLLLMAASLPQLHPTGRNTLPPLERTPPLPRPA